MARESRGFKSSSKKFKKFSDRTTITQVEETRDAITGRGGLALFDNYLMTSQIPQYLGNVFGSLRGSAKGIAPELVFEQVMLWRADGTSRHLTWFDSLKEDDGYARMMGFDDTKRLASSHQVKRFFSKFTEDDHEKFLPVIRHMTMLRMKEANPGAVFLFLDSMVMDNDDADKREGVEPTYKKVKGYHPLNLTWNGHFLDTLFRTGEKHSNHADEVDTMLRDAITSIRAYLGNDVPIVVLMDSGYYDDDLFLLCESYENVGYICAGKIFNDLKYLTEMPEDEFEGSYGANDAQWGFKEFTEQRAVWLDGRRGIYLRQMSDDGQGLLDFAGTHRVLVTNIGLGSSIDQALITAGHEQLLQAEEIIRKDHSRGGEELIHRRFKEFADQKLPFQSFAANGALYYLSVIAFNLFNSFTSHVAAPVFKPNVTPTTIRRQLFDIAAKVVRTGGKTILKIASSAWNRLKFSEMWELSFSKCAMLT